MKYNHFLLLHQYWRISQ